MDDLIQSIKLKSNLKLTISNSSNQLNLKKSDNTIFHEGHSRLKFIDDLKVLISKRDISNELIDFALGENLNKYNTTGANRNNLLLKLVGEKFISFDDDTSFKFHQLKNRESCLLSDKRNPFDIKYFTSQYDLEKYKKENIIEVDAKDVIEKHLESLKTNTLSISGSIGDSGSSSLNLALSFSKEPLEMLLNSDDLYSKISSRLLLKQSPNSKNMPLSPSMMMCAGFSNDLDLPPFFPIGRNEDGAYSLALRSCLGTQSSIGHIDAMIEHNPIAREPIVPLEWDVNLRSNDLISLVWGDFLRNSKSYNYSNASLFFKEVSSKTLVDFKSYLLSLASTSFSQYSLNLEQKIETISSLDTNAAMQWRELAHDRITKSKEFIKNSDSLLIEEFSKDQNNSVKDFKDLFTLYAHLLSHWFEIRRIAINLKS